MRVGIMLCFSLVQGGSSGGPLGQFEIESHGYVTPQREVRAQSMSVLLDSKCC